MKKIFTSSIGKKLVMGFTGVFLISFLIVHCYINALVFLPNGIEKYLAAGHFMGTNFIVRTMEVGLMAGIILHIVQGLMLTVQNRSKRPVAYNVAPGNKSSKWYSRSMGLLGTLILLFLVLHLTHFWMPNRYEQHFGTGHEINLYEKMELVFQNPWIVLVYVLGCISLAWHLIHGFWSAFQTLGLYTPKYAALIKGIGMAFSIIVPLIFIAMPVAFHFGWLPPSSSYVPAH
ncbi:succinate dehydrogenase [Taibaiella sp. KBW10]|uniref:succinate dehydrogenase cytochrome b subunit n=1 Tax=Taibaiella sp. KBW10 TaxID=2153357 RepID=UPI000F5AA363|nr:succinate dehydrogenase cytochrome b subunit [Taibaiella sp. KBW10]RQO31866.1 succinate dehydrogenase [Taibaiella sp. KBW10]